MKISVIESLSITDIYSFSHWKHLLFQYTFLGWFFYEMYFFDRNQLKWKKNMSWKKVNVFLSLILWLALKGFSHPRKLGWESSPFVPIKKCVIERLSYFFSKKMSFYHFSWFHHSNYYNISDRIFLFLSLKMKISVIESLSITDIFSFYHWKWK